MLTRIGSVVRGLPQRYLKEASRVLYTCPRRPGSQGLLSILGSLVVGWGAPPHAPREPAARPCPGGLRGTPISPGGGIVPTAHDLNILLRWAFSNN